MNLYRQMCALPRPSSYLGKILLVSFVGVHIPMIAAVCYVLLGADISLEDSMGILIALLLATLAGTVATMATLYLLLAPVSAAAKALRDYLENRTIPSLPTRYTDQAGTLMANVQEAITRLDIALDTAHGQRDEALRVHKEKFELLASMSHDLRTPLNHVIGFAELMSSEALGPLGSKRYQGYANDIQSSGGNLLSIVQNVLDLSAAEAGHFDVNARPADVGEAVRRAVNLMHHQAEASGIRFDAEQHVQPGLLAEIDDRSLKQMLIHSLQIAMADTATTTLVRVSADGASKVATIVVQSDSPWAEGDVPPEMQRLPITPGVGQRPADMTFRSSNPTSLRLSLVASLARVTNGQFKVGVTGNGGRQLVIVLPLANVQHAQDAA